MIDNYKRIYLLVCPVLGFVHHYLANRSNASNPLVPNTVAAAMAAVIKRIFKTFPI
jgi:hypothetical protein